MVNEIAKTKIVKKAIKDATVKLSKYKEPVITVKPKRARNKKGTYKADDKSTPDVNEAYVGGKAPKKKAVKKTVKITRKKVKKQ